MELRVDEMPEQHHRSKEVSGAQRTLQNGALRQPRGSPSPEYSSGGLKRSGPYAGLKAGGSA